jgi:signal peptidase I
MTSSTRSLGFAVAAAVAVAVAGWGAWLRPVTLGGNAAYVIVDGRSMEPTYEDGDLVLVRRSSSYAPGDVIAFRAGGQFEDPTRIIHRIVGGSSDGFQTQGDNRDRLDPWTPTDDDIIGKAQLHIPMAGDIASAIVQPEFFAAMGGAAVVLGGTRRRRRRRPQHLSPDQADPEAPMPDIVTPTTPQRPGAPAPRWARLTHPRWAFIGLVAAVLLTIPTLAMTWSAMRAPDTTSRIESFGAVDYAIGLDYRFTGEPSAVYPDGAVEAERSVAGALTPSDPLYSRLLDQLRITVDFRAEHEGADRLRSSAGFDVRLETPGGWSTELSSVEPAPFSGTTSETVDLDLDAIAAQVASVADLTGVGGGSYTISVVPTLDVSATAESAVVEDQLSAPMTFSVDGNLITADAVEATTTEELTRTIDERATYAIGPWDVSTQAARAVLSGLALVLVAGIAWFASVLFGGVGLGEPARIAARYRSQMIDVAAATAPPGPVVMVGGIDELARIAKVEQSVILHEDLGDGAHRYRVFLGSVTYEYETAPEHAGAAADELTPDADESGG